MISAIRDPRFIFSCMFLVPLLLAPRSLRAQNDVMGEIQFAAAGNSEKSSGVWVDGLYVGYLKELKGSKKVMLLPGKHEIVARQAGYKDFAQSLVLEPGQKLSLRVQMEKDPQATYPGVTAEVKLTVLPNRAAVFIDDRFVGHVNEFSGRGALLLAPGKHRVKISLPGYQTFESDINLVADQKFELRTELSKGSIMQAGPLLNEKDNTKPEDR